jgi:hypothetical protein
LLKKQAGLKNFKKNPRFLGRGVKDSVTYQGEANVQEEHTYREVVYTVSNEVTIPTHV